MIVSEVMVKSVKSVTNQATVTKALALMNQYHVKELPVLSGGKVKGLITMHSIISATHYNNELKVSKLMFMPPLLSERDDLWTVIKAMKEAGVQGLPVISGDSLVGFVSDFDVIKALKKELSGSVNDFMRDTPPHLKLDDNVARAKRLFHYERVKSLPVINAKDVLIGVLKEEDLSDLYKPHESMSKGVGGAGDSTKLLTADIKSILDNQYFYVSVGESIRKVVSLMLKNHLSSIIIVDDAGEPIGYLDRFEFIKYLYNERQPRGVYVKFSGLELDVPTNALLTKVVSDHLNRVNYLAKSIQMINVRIKGLHGGEGIRKFELDLKIKLLTGVTKRVSKVGYALRECLDEALTDIEKIMKKEYKKANP